MEHKTEKLFYHESIRKLLSDIADLNSIEGPVELICMWFDTLYFPAALNPEIYKPGVFEEAMREWEACFNSTELQALADFHDVYNSEVKALPTKNSQWEEDAGWQKVSAAARLALSKFMCNSGNSVR
jgi:hypothetical protein